MRGRSDLVASAAYQPEPSAAAAARRFVRQTLLSWDIAERSWDADRLVDDAVLLTSELVTNAVVHAGTALDVTCRLAFGELEVAVRDRHPARMLPDIPKGASTSAERGRGLLLPSALASSWGVTYARTAKAVWFRMSLARDPDASGAVASPPSGTTPAGGADDTWARETRAGEEWAGGQWAGQEDLDATGPHPAISGLASTDEASTDRPSTNEASTRGASTDGASTDGASTELSGAGEARPDLHGTDLGRPDLASPDLASPDLASTDLAGPDLASTDLAGPDLASPDLASTDLAGPDLAGTGGASPEPSAPDRAGRAGSAAAAGADADGPEGAGSAAEPDGTGAIPAPGAPAGAPETVSAGAETGPGAAMLAGTAGAAGRDGAEAGYAAAHPPGRHTGLPGPVTLTGSDPRGAAGRADTGARGPSAGGPPAHGRSLARAAGQDDAAAALRPDLGTLSYDELLRHTVETARDVVTADAAYALVADEDGELRVRAAAGVGVSESLFAPSVPAVFADGAAAKSLITVPFMVDGRVTGVLGAAAISADRFDGSDAAKLQRVADRVAMSLERARLSELERKRRGRIGFLAEASELLASTLDQEKTISLIAQLVVPRLAAWCAVLLADDAGELQPAYVWHADESLIDPLAGLLAVVGPPEADEAGRSWSLAMDAGSDLVDEAVVLASDAAWCFPLAARGRNLGVVVIGRPRGDRPPREALELTEDLARRAALALDNARLYEQQQLTSQALQRSLLPPELPRIPGVDLSVAHQVAGEGNEVGGDFYDVFPAGENRWRFAIGDVCGTGPEAAAVTGLARHALRILAREGHDVADVVGRLNELILEEGPRARFITLLHGELTVLDRSAPGPDDEGALFPSGGAGAKPAVRLRLVSAGHPLPLLLRGDHAAQAEATAAQTEASAAHAEATAAKAKASAAEAQGSAAAGTRGATLAAHPQPAAEPQPLLGVMGDLSFSAQTVDLYPGDLLLSVTDGITERRDATGRLLDDDDGLARLLARCGGLNAGAVAARIQRAADDYGTGPSTDDMALLVLRAL